MTSETEDQFSPNGRGAPPVTVTVPTAAAMRELGRRLGSVLRAGDLVILTGDLGAGKTTLTQGIGDGLGVRGPVTSPTFVIARVHPPVRAGRPAGNGPAAGGPAASGPAPAGPALVHADAYRIGSALELDDLDLDADTAAAVTVVEWGEGLAEGLAPDRLEITISRQDGVGKTPGDLAAAEAAAVAAADDVDAPRTVRITRTGDRWEGIELPLTDLANRL